MTWFLDCFISLDGVNSKFPVNTYYSENLSLLMKTAESVLTGEQSGIRYVRISPTTLGQNPMEITAVVKGITGK
jgi:hypothetical protein